MRLLECRVCGRVLEHTDQNFSKHKKGKFGLDTSCKPCARKKAKEWSRQNKERKKQMDADYARRNKEKIREYQKAYRKENSEKAREYFAEYTEANRERLLTQKREYFKRPEVKERAKKYQRERRKSDPKHRLFSAVRSAVSGMVSGKIGSTRHLPYTASQICEHLEKQFSKGMTWENYGKWHVDHIIPCAAFKISGMPDCKEFQACWALTNLRPMWASENMSKQDKRTHLI